MYINKGNLLTFILFSKRVFQFLNKHFYLVLLFTTIAKYTNTKFYQNVIWLVKLLVFINLIFGVGYIIYLSVLEHSFVNGFYMYQDILKGYLYSLIDLFNSYLDLLMDLWNEALNIEERSMKQSSNNNNNVITQDLLNQIKQEFKIEFKQVVDEALEKINEMEVESKSDNTIKNIAAVAGFSFLFYFFFILPGSPLTTAELAEFNWFNQSLIGFKLDLINLLSNTGKGGGSGTSFINSGSSTLMPNTPIVGNLTTMKGVQTNLNGMTVSKSVEVVNLLSDCLEEDTSKILQDTVNKTIKKITD